MVSWIFTMALRDSRGSRRRLLLFVSSMVLGVAALVAIRSFGDNLEQAVDNEALGLFGADMSLERGGPFSEATEALIDSLGGRQARRISFASMAFFPKAQAARLATVRAIDDGYPFYGAIETDPPAAAGQYQRAGGALLDGALLEQYGVGVGDTVEVGNVAYPILGEIIKTPRESAAFALFSPRVFVPLAGLDTLLLQRGSRAEYEVYFRFEDDADVEQTVEAIKPHLDEERVGVDTVAEVKDDWNEGLSNLYRFLGLVGLVALLLGGVGVASTVHVYIKQRIETVAVLRCLGARSTPTFLIFLVQAGVMGALAASIGCAIGVGIQYLVPTLLAEVLPVTVAVSLSWPAIALGFGVGLGVAVLFSLLPLLSVRDVSPLLTLRRSYEAEPSTGGVRMRWFLYAVIAIAVAGLSILQAPEWEVGLGYAAAIAVVFGLLAGVARLIIHFAPRLMPSGWTYPWRQGLSNLYRPNNQTLMLMLALGLGTFLILTLYLAQQTLMAQIQVAGGEGRPNTVLFDIQKEQLAGVGEIVRGQGLEIIEEVPIVTMRLSRLKGDDVDAIRRDSTRRGGSWALRREYRSSYRGQLSDAETLIEGDFVGRVGPEVSIVPISVERDLAQELNVTIGDTLVWDVQGLPITTYVSSLRTVDWQRFQTNFFVLFPEGVLEEAPQFYVTLTRTAGDAQSGALQSALFGRYPNVSSIDLTLVMNIFDTIYERIAFVLRFMALFSLFTGLIVLIAAVTVSRFQRIEESVLLKTLGASRRQLIRIMLIEYLFLGFFATATGMLLALAGSGALAVFVFDTPFVPALGPIVLVVLLITGLTLVIGLLNSRGIYARPPLEVLRAER
ncbi:MAG: FtsX-like permease family protein [Rhodothermales bacterium]